MRERITQAIRERGPLTVAEFMEMALYRPGGYYASAAQRSGRLGDFYTSVDVGPLFGETLAVQIAEMAELLRRQGLGRIDLVEAGAGNGRLMRDVLDALEAEHAGVYERLRVTLVERSPAARQEHLARLGRHAGILHRSCDALPAVISGVVFANELLDALPVHLLQMTGDGLREVFVTARGSALEETIGPPSAPCVVALLTEAGVDLEPGWRVEAGLAASRWVTEAASALTRGFLLLLDYGHEARDLYSAAHAQGTLSAYRRHTVDDRSWLADPGQSDLTAHVNLTAVRGAAVRAGCEPLGLTDQTYFLADLGIADRLGDPADPRMLGRRLAAKTLLLPGGLGSTIKVMAFGKRAGRPALRGFARARVT